MGTSQSQHETTSQSDQIRPSNSQSTQLEADVALINKNRIKKMIDQLDLDIKDASFILHEYSKEKESKTTLDIFLNNNNELYNNARSFSNMRLFLNTEHTAFLAGRPPHIKQKPSCT